MAWLRIDDGFMENPKIESLTAHELQVWMRVLCRGARQRSGELPTTAVRFVTGLTKPRLQRYVDVELLDRTATGYEIHDWAIYNPARLDADDLEQRVNETAARFPEASANELAALLGGRRKETLAAIKRFREPPIGRRSTETQVVPGTDREPPPDTDGTGSGNQAGTGSRAPVRARDAHSRARAARPVPVNQEPLLHPSPRDAARTNGRTDGDPERINPSAELERARRHA